MRCRTGTWKGQRSSQRPQARAFERQPFWNQETGVGVRSRAKRAPAFGWKAGATHIGGQDQRPNKALACCMRCRTGTWKGQRSSQRPQARTFERRPFWNQETGAGVRPRAVFRGRIKGRTRPWPAACVAEPEPGRASAPRKGRGRGRSRGGPFGTLPGLGGRGRREAGAGVRPRAVFRGRIKGRTGPWPVACVAAPEPGRDSALRKGRGRGRSRGSPFGTLPGLGGRGRREAGVVVRLRAKRAPAFGWKAGASGF